MTERDYTFGPSGETVFKRTYSRKKADGSQETWPETVHRVATGNMALVYGPEEGWNDAVRRERDEVETLIRQGKLLPAGRHLWATGAKGRQYLSNCHVSHWGEKLSDHFEFTFLRLMEGGGVGANYSSKYLRKFELRFWGYDVETLCDIPRRLSVEIVCDPEHPDYEEMKEQGLLSDIYDSDWEGAFIVEDSREGWASALVDLIDTYQQDEAPKHEHRVYDVTNVRPKGSRLKTFGGTASGPAPFARMMHEVSRVFNSAGESVHHLTPLEAMDIDHAIAECVVSGGVRRSARMSIVAWDDPYVHDFIHCKEDPSKHWTTNISVEIDDRFLKALDSEPLFAIDDAGYWHISERLMRDAKEVHRAVVKGMLTNGEPGYWNSSLSNVGEVDPVVCTNPCGEIALTPWEQCTLGHVNLDAFAPTKKHGPVDWAGLLRAHKLMARFLIRATYADFNDEKQRATVLRNRRIGVGHTGVQGFLAKQGIPYSQAWRSMFLTDLDDMLNTVELAARAYAFELRIPTPVKTTTVAPVGSVSKLFGVSEGIHSIYARYFERRIRFSTTGEDEREQVFYAALDGFQVEDDIYDKSGNTVVVVYPTKDLLVEQVEALGYPAEIVQTADELSLDDMLRFQEMYQKHYANNAVSFTVNVKPGLDPKEVEAILGEYLPTLKGTTLMVDESRPQAPYTRITEAEYEAAEAKRVEDSTDEECANGSCPIR